MTNSADPDQLASSEANWSGSTLFAKQDISGFSMTGVKFSLIVEKHVSILHIFYCICQEPVHSISYMIACAPNENSHISLRFRSLIRVFAGHSVGSQISKTSSGWQPRLNKHWAPGNAVPRLIHPLCRSDSIGVALVKHFTHVRKEEKLIAIKRDYRI